MIYYITKHVLTAGIEIVDGQIVEGHPSMLNVTGKKYHGKYFFGEGKDWHKTPERAQSRAMDMQKKKIKSLRAQLKRVKALNFSGKAKLTPAAIPKPWPLT